MAAALTLATTSVQPRRAPTIAVEGGTWWLFKYTPDSTYSSGGDAIDIVSKFPGQVRNLLSVILVPNGTTLGYQAAYDYTAKKVLLWNGTTQASGSISGPVFDMWVLTD